VVFNRDVIERHDPLLGSVPAAYHFRGLTLPGAREAVAWDSDPRTGDRIFTAGFDDPSLWSDSSVTAEVGMNRY
jgi:hypothetical protein